MIRRLLRKSLTDTTSNGTAATNMNNQSQSSICRVIEDILPDNCFNSDPEDENEQGDTGGGNKKIMKHRKLQKKLRVKLNLLNSINFTTKIIQYSFLDPPIEISISVPNLTELGYNLFSNITKVSLNNPYFKRYLNSNHLIDYFLYKPDLVERSISENENEKQNIKKLNQLKMERRAKNREKLMAMKRFSGFLKRPEILGLILRF